MNITSKYLSKNNLLTVAAFALALTIAFGLIHKLGFWPMVKAINSSPERLRNITFYIWEHYPISSHGFLTFLSLDDFDKKIAYSNYSPAYLLAMFTIYKIEMAFSSIPMRALASYVQMCFLAGVLIYLYVKENTRTPKTFQTHVLSILALVLLVSMPTYWISTGKRNVDNAFLLIVTFTVWIGYELASGNTRNKAFWLPIVLFVLFIPMAACLLGFYLFVREFKLSKEDFSLTTPKTFLFIFGGFFYVLPLFISRRLGFTSSNSSWLFRSGLDGDVTYFSNFINSVVHPFVNRPIQLIVFPAVFLFAQFVFIRVSELSSETREKKDFDTSLFLEVLFSQYLITLLLWPQAVSIHPYLYDLLLIGPICAAIFFNFAWRPTFTRHFNIWFWALAFCISFNLTQIAQAVNSVTVYKEPVMN